MTLTIGREDPRRPDVAALVRELDTMFHALYPAESNHLVDVESLAGDDMRFFVARRDGEPVGTGAIWLREPAFAEVKRIYVRPAARGLKLGRLILRRLEEEARLLSYPVLRLETGTLQPEALGLFASEGFTPRAAFADYPADDPFSLFFEKRLA